MGKINLHCEIPWTKIVRKMLIRRRHDKEDKDGSFADKGIFGLP